MKIQILKWQFKNILYNLNISRLKLEEIWLSLATSIMTRKGNVQFSLVSIPMWKLIIRNLSHTEHIWTVRV